MHISWSDEVVPYPDGLKKLTRFEFQLCKKNSWLAWYRAILHSDSDAVARCEANTQTGTLAEGFFVLDETTEGEGSGLSNRQLDKGCKAKAGSSRPRANSIARAHRMRSASGEVHTWWCGMFSPWLIHRHLLCFPDIPTVHTVLFPASTEVGGITPMWVLQYRLSRSGWSIRAWHSSSWPV